MAIVPNAFAQPRGIVGTWANMEEDNARTGFAGEEFAAGIPVALGEEEMQFVPLADGDRLAGIALATNDMQGTPTEDGAATFAEGAIFAVADMGTVFVLAGEDVAEGALAYYEPTTRKFHGTAGAGRLLMPSCEFDESAADGSPVALRIRVIPGADVVAAE